LDAGTLTIRHELQRVKAPGADKSSLILVSPKTEKSRRQIVLPKIAVGALVAHRTNQNAERDICGSKWQQSRFVFTSSIGTPLDQKHIFREFRRVLIAAGLPIMRFHDLRHSATSLLLAQGVHPRYIMELLGHSTITLTMNTYAHVLRQLKCEAANTMVSLLGPVAVNLAVKEERERPN
jgi:integrase